MRLSIPILLLLLATGCAAPEGGGDTLVYGYYESGFEVEAFTPCDGRERWWVASPGALAGRYDEVAEQPYERVFVRLRARVSPVGTYGHLGQYRRQIDVVEVEEILPADEIDPARCPHE